MSASTELPLVGVRVVDLTSNIAAPFAGAVLADLGADVVHVESLAGDDSRRMSPRIGDASAYFHVVNRNKTSARLDVGSVDGRAELMRMLATADVFITNLRPGKLEHRMLDATTLNALHPHLIHAALSGYGSGGDERDRAGYDAVLQARTGIAYVTGDPTGPPVRAGVSVLDVGAGTWLALGVLAALYRRQLTGLGGSVATSLFETGASWVAYHVAAFQISGEESDRHGSGHPAFAPYGIFRTRDGSISIGIGSDGLFRRLSVAIGAPELATDARYETNADRVGNASSLRIDLEQILARWYSTDAVACLMTAGIPVDFVRRPENLLLDPQAEAMGVHVDVELTTGESLRFPGLPITFDGCRPQVRLAGPT